MKEMLKNTLILLIITVAAGALLGIVNENTKGIIAQREAEDKKAAYKEVFTSAADFKSKEAFMDDLIKAKLSENGFAGESIDELCEATDQSGSVLGYVFTITTHEGYGGDIVFTMGVKNDGTVNGISILNISETAGLGMEADKVLKPQFAGKNVESFIYTKTGAAADNEIDAISGATITTNAITNGVNCGLYYFNNYLGGADHE